MSDLSSSFEPGTPQGKQLYRRTYRRVVKQLKIDPIREGAALRRRINKLFTDDILALRDESEQDRRRKLANELAQRYARRAAKFWEIFIRLNYTEGQERAVRTMKPFLTDAAKEAERLARKKAGIEAV